MSAGDVLAKDALRPVIQSARRALEDRIEGMSPQQLTRDRAMDGLSLKDIVAHITAWERRLVDAIETWQRGETPAWPEPGATLADVDRINDRDFAAHRDRALDDVLAEAAVSFARTMALIDSLADIDIVEPNEAFNIPLSLIIRANTDEHYLEHVAQIDAWLAAQRP
jgi:hypothetical protein